MSKSLNFGREREKERNAYKSQFDFTPKDFIFRVVVENRDLRKIRSVGVKGHLSARIPKNLSLPSPDFLLLRQGNTRLRDITVLNQGNSFTDLFFFHLPRL